MLGLSDPGLLWCCGNPRITCVVERSVGIHTIALECFVLKMIHVVYALLGKTINMTTLNFMRKGSVPGGRRELGNSGHW